MLRSHHPGALETVMILSVEQRETLHRWLPTILVVAGIWLAARGIKKLFWAVFGLAWAFHWAPGAFRFWH
jgi:hypothetical protein